jgi:spore coat polysaccharide biosynthesis protein SpsF
MKRRILILVQARVGSSRLPGKVLKKVLGKELLLHMIERIERVTNPKKVIVITTENNKDDQIVSLCEMNNIECFRGSEDDLLDRHYKAAIKYEGNLVIKIPSDCPLIDPAIIDRVIGHYLSNEADFDYISNLHPPSYPDGHDVELMTLKTLKIAWNEANRLFEREHTTPYIWENPGKFRIGNVKWETQLDYSASHRWTLDYEEDYLFIKAVLEELFPSNPTFGINDVLQLLKHKPWIHEINRKYVGRYWYDNHLDELKHIEEYKTRQRSE